MVEPSARVDRTRRWTRTKRANRVPGLVSWRYQSKTARRKNEASRGSKALSQHEFLRCMRKIREHEIQIVREALAVCNEDGSGMISLDKMAFIFRKLGYIAEISAVNDAVNAIGLSLDDKLDLSEFWQV